MANIQDRGASSTASIILATAIVAGLTGYFLGQARSIGLLGGRARDAKPGQREAADADSDLSDSDSEGGDDDAAQGELASFPDTNEECKLVLVVRTDLGMTKGKIAAQCSHATLACYKTMLDADPQHSILKRWERLGQAKVAVKIPNEDDMLLLQAQAVSLGLCARVIHDAGRTQIASGSATVLGVGPAPKSVVDKVTGHLTLL